MNENRLTDEQLEQLLEVGRSLVSELDLEALLRRVLEAARDLTGAAYAALGVLDEDKTGLERFIHSGIDEETRRAIGPLPRGRGVLGELIRRPRPLRLADVNTHPTSYGFPPGHPVMKTFLGTPVLVRGEAWGNLYLTEKEGGAEFDERDEQLAVVLAAWAGVAIENVRLYDSLRRRRAELERALRGLEASTDISRTVAGGIEVDDLLELIAKRGRGVVDAHQAMVLLSDGEELEIAAAAGDHPEALVGQRIPDSDEWLAELNRSVPDLQGLQTLTAPLAFRERLRGMLVAVDRPGGRGFDADERHVFDAFAASAATTIATLEAAEAEKLKLSIEASERERRRWARELHDETLQELGALRFVLETVGDDASALLADLRQGAIEHVNRSIRNLQGLITELRPSVLDELGVKPAIEALARQSADRFGIEIEVDVGLASEGDAAPRRLAPDLEATIYRLAQEGLNNAIKHAAPEKITVAVADNPTTVTVVITDDGRGFDPKTAERSFGLIGMEERVALAGGTLRVQSAPGEGTEVRAELPLAPAQEGAGESHQRRPPAPSRPGVGR